MEISVFANKIILEHILIVCLIARFMNMEILVKMILNVFANIHTTMALFLIVIKKFAQLLIQNLIKIRQNAFVKMIIHGTKIKLNASKIVQVCSAILEEATEIVLLIAQTIVIPTLTH